MDGATTRIPGRSVLAIGAHPDDVELGCGGALLAHVAAGDTVTVLVMTGGENGPGDEPQVDGRRAEQERAAATLGATLVWGGLRDCEVVADSATVRRLEQCCRTPPPTSSTCTLPTTATRTTAPSPPPPSAPPGACRGSCTTRAPRR